MKRKMNRIISMLLSAMLVFTALPEAVFAYDGAPEAEEVLTEAEESEAAVPAEAADGEECAAEVAGEELPEADGASESEDNNSVEKANPISVNTEYSGNIASSSDKDYYRFHLDAAGVVSFAFAHDFVDKSDRLWKMRLYRAEYVTDVLMEREFRGNETQTLTTVSVGLPAGDYILLLTEYYWSDAAYRFKVNYTKSDAWEKERNETVTTPSDILTNKEYSGSIMESDDKDYYRFHLDEDGVVSFAFAHDFVDKSDRLWKMRLYRAEYVTDVLMEREFRGNETQTLTTASVGLPAGDYILLLTEYYWSDATYRFTVNYTKSDAWEKERNETVTTPSDILTNKEYSGSIMESDDKDYYRFHLDEAGVVSFAFAHDFVDKNDRLWKIRLYRAEYVTDVLMEREFRGNETKTLTTASVGLPAGDYILLLTEYYWSDATYRFTVNYTKSDAWEKERNETVTTPNDILTNKEYSGSIMESNDKDYYRFSLEKAATVSFTFSHVFVDNNDRYWKLRLYSADEVTNVLFEQEFRGNEKKAITTGKIKLSAGTYIILLTEYYWSDVTYRFTVNDASSGKPKKESNPTDVIPGGGGATDPQPLLSMDKEQSIVLVKGQKFMMADSGWKSAAKKVVSVSKKTVKAKAEGETDLTLGEYSIHAKVVSVEQTKNEKNLKLEAGESGMISLGGSNAKSGMILIGGEELPVCFMTSAPDVALVDDSGSVTAVAAGTATITAYINGVAFKCKIKVSESTPKLHRTLHVNLGKSKSIKIKGMNKAEWVPAEEDIVKIQKNKITGLHAGTTTLSYGEHTVDVIVEDPSIEGSSKPYAQTLNMKARTEETITLKKVDQPVFFKSSKPHIAWVDEDGVIHARSKGTAKLTAKINGRSIKITVKVD